MKTKVLEVFYGDYCGDRMFILDCDEWLERRIFDDNQFYKALPFILWAAQNGYEIKSNIKLNEFFIEYTKRLNKHAMEIFDAMTV